MNKITLLFCVGVLLGSCTVTDPETGECCKRATKGTYYNPDTKHKHEYVRILDETGACFHSPDCKYCLEKYD